VRREWRIGETGETCILPQLWSFSHSPPPIVSTCFTANVRCRFALQRLLPVLRTTLQTALNPRASREHEHPRNAREEPVCRAATAPVPPSSLFSATFSFYVAFRVRVLGVRGSFWVLRAPSSPSRIETESSTT